MVLLNLAVCLHAYLLFSGDEKTLEIRYTHWHLHSSSVLIYQHISLQAMGEELKRILEGQSELEQQFKKLTQDGPGLLVSSWRIRHMLLVR